MTSMAELLELGRKRQQRDIAGFLDGIAEAPLVRRADARDTPRNDLAALRDEGVQKLHVLVVDVIDLLNAKTAYLFASEILFLLGGDGFVAAGGTLCRAPRSSFGFRHG